jgi:hypothetical protein
MSAKNGHSQLTVDELKQLRPLSAGDYYWAKTHAPKNGEGEIAAEDFAFYSMAHAAKRKGLVETDDVFEFLDRVDISSMAELATVLSEEIGAAPGPLAKTRTTSSRRSATSGG